MGPRSAPFSWSEDVDECLNFWFWLRRVGDLDDEELEARLRDWAGFNSRVERHRDVSNQQRWAEYLPIGQAWRAVEAGRQMSDPGLRNPRHLRAHYRTLAAIGISLRVEWVMAPFGERWLIPPDLVFLGADGAKAEQRQTAVVGAAAALRDYAPTT
jgi:hypothetical protein